MLSRSHLLLLFSVDQYEDQAWDPGEFVSLLCVSQTVLKWSASHLTGMYSFLIKEDSEDDYEDPDEDNISEGDASGGDYESPEEGSDSDNGYEPPPSEPKEDTAQICPAKPMENSDYIGTQKWTLFHPIAVSVLWKSHDGIP